MSQQNLKTIVRGAYDIQKLRIQMGNRIVGNFKAKLGQDAGEKEETLDEDAKQILDNLRTAFKKLTDGVSTFPKQKTFKGEGVISSFTELCLVAQYVGLEKHEKEHFKRLGQILREYPVFTGFLDDVNGVGPAMAGVIVSEIDISKAIYASSLWAYAGLDSVSKWIWQRTSVIKANLAAEKPSLVVETELDALEADERCIIPDGEIVLRGVADGACDREPQDGKYADARNECIVKIRRDGYEFDCLYRQFHCGGRSRRKEHLRDVEYKDKDGKTQTKKGITFNPFLKTKLTGVLGPSFLKVKESPYKDVYYDYKHRLESHPKYGLETDTSKGRRHNMAIRYAVKRFLVDLYVAWRTIEGLPVAEEYSKSKLGIEHAA